MEDQHSLPPPPPTGGRTSLSVENGNGGSSHVGSGGSGGGPRFRSPVEQKIDKIKEKLIDVCTPVMQRIASDRTNLVFYGGIAVLCMMIIAVFTVDKGLEDAGAWNFGDSSPIEHHGSGAIMMGTTTEGKPLEETLLQPVPTNINIAIIGDSISRYSYLSLIYFLRWGRWFEPTLEKSNLMCEVSFKSPFHDNQLAEFFFQSGRQVQPYELCDCYKQTDEDDADHLKHIENRFYHDPKLNNTVTFLHAYGHQLALHGRIKPNEAHDRSKWDFINQQNGLLQHEYKEPIWKYDDWADVVTEYLAKLQPKPDYVIVNAGQFENEFGNANSKSKEVSKKFANALKQLGIKASVWKTTTYQKGGEGFNKQQELTDMYMCELLGNCLDLSWTKSVVDFLYWDDRHFYEPIYRAMNEQLLAMLGLLPKEYNARIRKEKIMKGYVDESDNEYVFHMSGIDDEDDDDSV